MLQAIYSLQKRMIDIHVEILVDGSNVIAQCRHIIVHNDQFVGRHLLQILNDFFIKILVGQMLILEMRHDHVVVISSHIFVQDVDKQLGITMVDIQIHLCTGTEIVDKGVINFELVVAQFIQQKEDFDLRIGDVSGYVITFPFYRNNYFFLLK